MKITESKLRETIKEVLEELFGFKAKSKHNVDCDELAKRYQSILYSSLGTGSRQELFRVKRDLQKYCPDMAKNLEETEEK